MWKDFKSTFSRSSHGNLWRVGRGVVLQEQNTVSFFPRLFLCFSGVAASIRLRSMLRLSCDHAQDNRSWSSLAYPKNTDWFQQNTLDGEHLLSSNASKQWRIYDTLLGRTWFSCSLYSFHCEQAEQKSSMLLHQRWRKPEYSIFRDCIYRIVRWPVPKQGGGALPTLYWDIFRPFQIDSDNHSYWKNMGISRMDWKHVYFVILFFFFLAIRLSYYFTIQTIITWFSPEYSEMPIFACFRWLFWSTGRTLKLLNQVRLWWEENKYWLLLKTQAAWVRVLVQDL